MQNTSANNRIKFLMDGATFFQEFSDLAHWVATTPWDASNAGNNDNNKNTYIRLGYWAASSSLTLPNPAGVGAGPWSLADALREVAKPTQANGYDVKVILWSLPSYQLNIAGSVGGDPTAFVRTFQGETRISVFAESYNGWIAGASQHQKIAIFCRQGQRQVLVGGINLDDWYQDTINHNNLNPPYNDASGIHDTAVRIQGPATDAIENEWSRRWKKSKQALHSNTTVQQTYNSKVVASTASSVTSAGISTTIATTNSESWWGRQTDIQSLLTQNISDCDGSIYFENYAFDDPALVATLAAKLETNANFPIHINVPPGPAGPLKYLTSLSEVKLGVRNCTSVKFQPVLSPGGQPIARRRREFPALQPGTVGSRQGYRRTTRR